MTRLKRVAKLSAGGTPDVSDETFWRDAATEDGTPWVAISDMSDGSIVNTTHRHVSPSGIREKRLPLGLPGTVLFAMYASVGAIAELGVGASWNQALLGIEPRAGQADAHFLRYWLEHLRPTLGALTRSNTQDNLNAEQVGNFPFPILDLAEQRAIAYYLDAETARIDALITKKRRMIALLVVRRGSILEHALAARGCKLPRSMDTVEARNLRVPAGWRVPKLSNVLRQLTNGFVGPTRDILRDQGIRYIQGLHIKKGKVDFDRRPYFVEEAWHRSRPRTSLQQGDVVIVQTGDIGQCAVIPEAFGEANCHALLIARCDPEVTTGDFLAAYFQSDFGRHSLLRLATGALHPHLEFGIRDARVVVPPLDEQNEIVQEVVSKQGQLDRLSQRLDDQIQLLAERRQALITAAVTGELEIPGVAA